MLVYDMNGQYRQPHEGVALWLGPGGFLFDSYISVGRMKSTDLGIDDWTWVFALFGALNTNSSNMYGFCKINPDGEVTEAMKLKPWDCAEWWVWDFNVMTWSETWHIDEMMDVDQCDENGDEISSDITLDELLCFTDRNVASGEYSHYQGLFGLYQLNSDETFDGQPYYSRPDLEDVDEGNWYLLWLDEQDSWVINDYIPYQTVMRGGHVFFYESYCSADTPTNCTETWPLYQGYEDIDSESSNAVMFKVVYCSFFFFEFI